MDLVYMDSYFVEQDVFSDFSLDLAFGKDENNFELSTSLQNHVCDSGYMIYVDGTEYGGMISGILIDTESNSLTYKGKTWHGILNSKVIEPDNGEDYFSISGDSNEVLQVIIEKLHLSELFEAERGSGIMIPQYQFKRYVKGYEGICEMLESIGMKLKMKFNSRKQKVILYSEYFRDYSESEEFDSDQVDFQLEKNYKAVNHLICLGRGELKNRTVIHLYTDTAGNISKEQSFFGIDEITDVYDNTNAEDDGELERSGIQYLKELWNSDSLQIDFETGEDTYDVGDIVGAREVTTQILVFKPITKKIVKMNDNTITIQYKVGGEA